MGFYSEYLNRNLNFEQLSTERKLQLKAISKIREGRDVIVYASDVNNKQNAPVALDSSDILPFQDQLATLKGTSIDVVLETPGGAAEAVEDIVSLLRAKYEHIGIIIPGIAKSAGTIFAMAGDEILMGIASSLGPIDAQIITPSKRYSADAFLEGLEKIKAEVAVTGRLNPAYIPILQNISPGEIQHCENAQNFSRKLVTQWLSQYKFKFWDTHSSTGMAVTPEEKALRATEIANKLCKHSDWLTHGRSIKIADLEAMRLKITDYSKVPALDEAITRYYTLLRMSLEPTNIYKIIETDSTQILRFHTPNISAPPSNAAPDSVILNFECPTCHTRYEIQARLAKQAKSEAGKQAYPKNDIFVCNKCKTKSNLAQARLQIEAQTGKKLLF